MKQWQDFETKWVSEDGEWVYANGGNTYKPMRACEPGWDFSTAACWGSDLIASSASPAWRANPTAKPTKHIMRCNHCGTSSMIPDSTDKILALVCPQCGGALHE